MRHLKRMFVVVLTLSGLFLGACGPSFITVRPTSDRGQDIDFAQVSYQGTIKGTGVTTFQVPDMKGEVSVSAQPQFIDASVDLAKASSRDIVVKLATEPGYSETQDPSKFGVSVGQDTMFPIAKCLITGNEWWRFVVLILTDAGYKPQIMDEKSGYLLTNWKEKEYREPGGDRRYLIRRRIAGGLAPGFPPSYYKVRVEVERQYLGDSQFRPWNRLYPDDLQVLKSFKSKIEEGVACVGLSAPQYGTTKP